MIIEVEEIIIESNNTIEKDVELLIQGGLDKKEAIKKVAKDRKMIKNDVYRLFNKE